MEDYEQRVGIVMAALEQYMMPDVDAPPDLDARLCAQLRAILGIAENRAVTVNLMATAASWATAAASTPDTRAVGERGQVSSSHALATGGHG
jgi:hypothetical protein